MWYAKAPSNIALIKYMGKLDTQKNLPINASLSYTISHLCTQVSLKPNKIKTDVWQPNTQNHSQLNLSHSAQERFLEHLRFLKKLYACDEEYFIVESSNNFPHGAGIASSASSFAALTKCFFLALKDLANIEIPSIEYQANLSRCGSGSSCRSFFSPWAFWEHDTVKSIELPYKKMLHQVILISKQEKSISSGLAHSMIKSSPHYKNRSINAARNMQELLLALNNRSWQHAFEICWQEFEALHQLFETSTPYFSYKNKDTHKVLSLLQKFWLENKDGPIVTMDAGPNIHLLYREDQESLKLDFQKNYLRDKYDVL